MDAGVHRLAADHGADLGGRAGGGDHRAGEARGRTADPAERLEDLGLGELGEGVSRGLDADLRIVADALADHIEGFLQKLGRRRRRVGRGLELRRERRDPGQGPQHLGLGDLEQGLREPIRNRADVRRPPGQGVGSDGDAAVLHQIDQAADHAFEAIQPRRNILALVSSHRGRHHQVLRVVATRQRRTPHRSRTVPP